MLDFSSRRAPVKREKPKVRRRIPVKKQRDGSGGDNSNAQYAALGLRSCHDAGIIFEQSVILLARKWWYESLHDPDKSKGPYAGAGWSYRDKNKFHAYGSMTAGAAGGVVIYNHMLRQDWKKDKAVVLSMQWIATNFTVKENPGPPERHAGEDNHYYFLYAMERLGILYNTKVFGRNHWYEVGANFLIDDQKGDGSWKGYDPIANTCFAILFLRRATRPLAR